jgi:hypothetical protein
MAYATIEDLRVLLPENITIGDTTAINVLSGKRDTISTEVANKYLQYAAQFVDSKLSGIYLTPLERVNVANSKIISNMMPSSCDVMVDDIVKFRVGACVRLSDTNGSEIGKVKEIPENFDEGDGLVCNTRHITLSSPTINAYDSGSDATIEMLIYPDPVSVMTARFAASFMFDRLYTTDGSPDVSNYGKSLRNLAREDMDAIISGQTRLKGQKWIAKRFVRMPLFDTFKQPGENQTGQRE